MTSSEVKYIRLSQLGTVSLGGGHACARPRSLIKGCVLVSFFLCLSSLIYVARISLFSQPAERTHVPLQCCRSGNCNVTGITSLCFGYDDDDNDDDAGNSRSTSDSDSEGDGGGTKGLNDRKSTEDQRPAEKTFAEDNSILHGLSTSAEGSASATGNHQDQRVSNRPDVDDVGSDDASSEGSYEQPITVEKDQVKKFFFFNPRPSSRNSAEFDDCRKYRACAMASSAKDADVVLFNAARMRHVESLPTRRSNQIWVMYSREPPDLPSMDALDRPDLQNQVNYSRMVYSDSTWQVKYGLLQETTPPKKNYEKVYRQKRYDVAWFVSHCDRPSRRMDYVRRMMSTVDVHIYGRCGNYTCGDRGYNMGGEKDDCLELLSKEYKFYLSFENTMCRDYVSEKFFNIFEGVDVIPVVRGGADYRSLFPADILIDASDFPSPESLGTYLHLLGNEEDHYLRMLRKKNRYKKHRHKTDFFCDLCERAHTGKPRHVYENFYQWVRAPGNCWKPTDLDPA